jgi:hypothetical protein
MGIGHCISSFIFPILLNAIKSEPVHFYALWVNPKQIELASLPGNAKLSQECSLPTQLLTII